MPLGHRLAASRLISRFPISQGRALLPKIIETARRLNADPHASHRISSIFLFGSVLTGEDDADAGDIDLVVDTRRRKIAKELMGALIEAEERAMPGHMGFRDRLHRQHNELCRAIKKVSNKISLHGFGDVEVFSAAYRELYRYDVDTEAETSVDAEVKRGQPDTRRSGEEERQHVVPPPLVPRAWPVAPNTPVVLEPMDEKRFPLAQHLWMKGVDLADIAKRLELSERTTDAYLASRNGAKLVVPPPFDIGLDWMVDQVLDQASPYGVIVELTKRHRVDVTIRCEIVDVSSFDRLASIRKFAASDTSISGRCDLLPLLEPVAETAWAWWDKVRDRFVGLSFHTLVVRLPSYRRAGPKGRRRPDLRPLLAPLNDLLDHLSPRHLGMRRRDERIEFRREMGSDRLYHCIGDEENPGSSETRLTQRSEPQAWRRIKAALQPQTESVHALGDFTLGVDGR